MFILNTWSNYCKLKFGFCFFGFITYDSSVRSSNGFRLYNEHIKWSLVEGVWKASFIFKFQAQSKYNITHSYSSNFVTFLKVFLSNPDQKALDSTTQLQFSSISIIDTTWGSNLPSQNSDVNALPTELARPATFIFIHFSKLLTLDQ